jgi:hypothetical protein
MKDVRNWLVTNAQEQKVSNSWISLTVLGMSLMVVALLLIAFN